ncbi:MAG: YdiU family protein [Gammaproteobacteria bacterium]|nr:YdiU family protein [Gammaproteobacteria bacterium]
MREIAYCGLRLQADDPYARLGPYFSVAVQPRPLSDARLVVASPQAAALLDWPEQVLQQPEFLALLAGQAVFDGVRPLAMVYAGHQFGGYTPQLGDGRGQLLAQLRNRKGELWDLHLKGAGLTPFSRDGDGCAVLRSSIREFLASEHLAALGIATTRALAVADSDMPVRRELTETAATLLRLARSHVRFGHFEYFYYTRQYEHLHQLMDYVLDHHYPECRTADNPLQAMFAAISQRTAGLLAGWQAYGFCHGVMNTDNMSIVGETLDYGPFAFLERYQPDYVCNSSDFGGRYAFNRQVEMAEWNLTALGQTFTGRVELDALRATLADFAPLQNRFYLQRMRARLGLAGEEAGDGVLVQRLLKILQTAELDYNGFFRQLSDTDGLETLLPLAARCVVPADLQQWLQDWWARAMPDGRDNSARQQAMQAVNPLYVLRNSLIQETIEAAHRRDYQPVRLLYQLMSQPFVARPGFERYAQPTPVERQGWPLSCSS